MSVEYLALQLMMSREPAWQHGSAVLRWDSFSGRLLPSQHGTLPCRIQNLLSVASAHSLNVCAAALGAGKPRFWDAAAEVCTSRHI